MSNLDALRAALDLRAFLETELTRCDPLPVTHDYLRYGLLLEKYRAADLDVHLLREALIAPRYDPQYPDLEAIGV